MGEATGFLTDIQRFSLYDGPGIRTTVFFKGCPLRCLWCHNPEGIDPRPQLRFVESRCVLCGRCAGACPGGLHHIQRDGKHTVNREKCMACGACAAACPAEALKITGREYTVAQVMRPVLADERYYQKSGGGLTVSGGEPLMQPVFLEELLAAAKERGVHTAIETSGCAPWNAIKRILPLTDLFLFDYKETNSLRHRELTGRGNEEIIQNLDALLTAGAKVLLRCPVIPGVNDREEHFRGIAGRINRSPGLTGCELMAYHKLGMAKYKELGQAYHVDAEEMSAHRRAEILSWISARADQQVKWG